jgi:nucleoside-diphosphate-sugar epimerase
MLAAAAGKPFHIGFSGISVYNFASDTADAFIRAVRTELSGAEAFNLGGHTVHMSKIVSTIEKAVPEAAGTITFEHSTLPFPEDVDITALNRALGPLTVTPLVESVATTIKTYKQVLDSGLLVYE